MQFSFGSFGRVAGAAVLCALPCAQAEDLDEVRRHYADQGVPAELEPFFRDLPQRIADSHLVVSRAGASTVAELAVIGRPSILIPLPYAMDDHQTPNANILARAGAAWSVAQRGLTPDVLAKGAEHFKGDKAALADILETRLFPDMLPFSFQVVSIAHHSVGAIAGARPSRCATRRSSARPAPPVGSMPATPRRPEDIAAAAL